MHIWHKSKLSHRDEFRQFVQVLSEPDSIWFLLGSILRPAGRGYVAELQFLYFGSTGTVPSPAPWRECVMPQRREGGGMEGHGSTPSQVGHYNQVSHASKRVHLGALSGKISLVSISGQGTASYSVCTMPSTTGPNLAGAFRCWYDFLRSGLAHDFWMLGVDNTAACSPTQF